jgi:CBS domain-containing protein
MRLAEVLRAKAQKVVSLDPTASVPAALTLMKAQNVGAVLVLDHADKLIGLVSERDIVLGLAKDGPGLLRRQLRDIMSFGGPSATPDETAANAMRVMTERRARHLPVLDDTGVVGVVSIGDLLKSRLEESLGENSVLRDLALAHLAAA